MNTCTGEVFLADNIPCDCWIILIVEKDHLVSVKRMMAERKKEKM